MERGFQQRQRILQPRFLQFPGALSDDGNPDAQKLVALPVFSLAGFKESLRMDRGVVVTQCLQLDDDLHGLGGHRMLT